MDKRSQFNSHDMMLIIVAILIKRLGGRVEINQSDMDDMAYQTLYEDGGFPDGHIELYIKEKTRN